MNNYHKSLTFEEKDIIRKHYCLGYTISQTCKAVGRSYSTVQREFKRIQEAFDKLSAIEKGTAMHKAILEVKELPPCRILPSAIERFSNKSLIQHEPDKKTWSKTAQLISKQKLIDSLQKLEALDWDVLYKVEELGGMVDGYKSPASNRDTTEE